MSSHPNDDPYAHLPTDLVALLRDPRITVPGQLQALECVHRWTTNTADAARYIDPREEA